MEFPAVKFAKENTVYQQLLHVRSEALEVQAAVNDLRMVADEAKLKYAAKIIEECFDLKHSAETLIRVVLREYPELDEALIKEEVIRKNAARNYY